ncbi:MAG: beta-lactamase family protein [Verrucomicrobiales bacterium]|nr:beta-lactamase family protein [Verrucomicrobiales bacterium]MCP5558377.1 beta-lactamase family protein [Verrucomicrobiaceae bacterium]
MRCIPLLCLFLTLCTIAQSQTSEGPDAKKLEAVSPQLQKFVDDGQIAGAVVLAAFEGKVICEEAVGFRDLESKDPMQKDSLFWIASMTKPITSMAVMMLQDEKKLNINDPVEKYLPEFHGQMLVSEKKDDTVLLKKPSRPITIKDLLMHTSGLTSKSPLDNDAIDVLSLKEAVITYALTPLQFEPGSQWSYCNPGMNTLGRLIEVVSGMEYSRFLQARIFNPLRMKETTFWPDKKRLQKLATSYKPTADGKGLEPTPIKYLTPPFSNRKRTPLAAGGLFSTAEDLLKLYTMLLNGGEADGRRILSAAALKEMTTIQSDDLKTGFTEGMAMGLGFHIVREPTGVTAMLSPGTFGHGGAHGTQGWIDPERKTIYILLIQRAALNNGDASPMRQAFQQAIAEALPPVVKAAVKP